MPLYDFQCPNGHLHDLRCSIADKPKAPPCPECGQESKQVLLGMPPTLTTIIPSYPGCKKKMAGYVYSHGDRKGDKIQVGYGGKITTSDQPKKDIATEGMTVNPLADLL